MAEEQDIKQETVEETEDTTNVEELTVEKTEEAVADAAQVFLYWITLNGPFKVLQKGKQKYSSMDSL